MELAGGVPFVSGRRPRGPAPEEEQVDPETTDAALDAYSDARIDGLQSALSILAVLAVVALFLAQASRRDRPAWLRGRRRQRLVGPVAAGGSSIDARRFVSGLSGTRMRPRVGRSRSNVTRSSRETRPAAREDRDHPSTEESEVEGEQAESDRCAHHFHRQHGAGYPIAQARDTHRLHVDHVVERLEDKRGACSHRARRRAPARRAARADAAAAGRLAHRHRAPRRWTALNPRGGCRVV